MVNCLHYLKIISYFVFQSTFINNYANCAYIVE